MTSSETLSYITEGSIHSCLKCRTPREGSIIIEVLIEEDLTGVLFRLRDDSHVGCSGWSCRTTSISAMIAGALGTFTLPMSSLSTDPAIGAGDAG